MYYLTGTSEEPPQASLKGLNVRNGFAWFDELKAAFLKFPVVDKFTEANCDYKKFGFPKCVGRGWGGSNRRYPYKLRYFA